MEASKAVRSILLSAALSAVLCLPALGSSETRDKIKIRKKTRLQSNAATGPTQEYNAERATVLAQKRRNLILDIQRFIREAHDSDQKAELNLRLGSLYM